MGKPIIIAPSDKQVRSIISISKTTNKYQQQIGILQNIKVYQLENGELEIEVQDGTILSILNFNSREYETYLEHESKCENCKLGNCQDMQQPRTKSLHSNFTPSLACDTQLNFYGQEYTGLSNKTRRLDKQWQD
ncbi:hypothetical protein SS50377_26716 [Spironucleus salmonicida]|uniref:Uncharacterized protein n=1 Tax=Spironucleus salmonicida TaxID=348837 RepID=V6LY81_9EUKA|nr:hypothetical protein SS50377_26716 [Spironucleus salmonicida]|eukprot:EST49188.1 Hypothetical protein SS50377_10403 [Spironucleus salmonicida]